jgi:hypothetical protein
MYGKKYQAVLQRKVPVSQVWMLGKVGPRPALSVDSSEVVLLETTKKATSKVIWTRQR